MSIASGVQRFITFLLVACATWANAANAHRPSVVDDLGRRITLDAPAQRIVSLAPHITENLFSIGAGHRIVGTVSFSDYPEAAKDIPRLGSDTQLDIETLLSLKPDLVISWVSGGTRSLAERLETLGITVFHSESHTFDDVATTFERFGHLTGTNTQAQQLADNFRRRVAELRAQHHDASPVSVFYQVWDQPLMTVSEPHLITEAISLCGGRNVFSGLDSPIPRISIENVLAANPDVIAAGGMSEDRQDWLEAWKRWPQLQAVQHDHLVFIPPSLIQRHTARVLNGTSLLCEALNAVRDTRTATP